MSTFDIFISHSAREDDARAVLDALYRRLKKARFEVLLDRERLTAGREWRRELFTWLQRCHGAVILLSADAVESSWVLQEATILNWRRQYEKGFVIIPVYLPPVTPSVFESGWFSALEIRRLQGVVGSLVDGVDGIVEAVAARLQEALPALRAAGARQAVSSAHAAAESPSPSADQVAAVCYRRHGREVMFLLVRASFRKRWVLPKGLVRGNEPFWLTAQMEARREAGVAGHVYRDDPLRFRLWPKERQSDRVEAYLIEVLSKFQADQDFREPTWCTLEEAIDMLRIGRTADRHLRNAEAMEEVLTVAHRYLARQPITQPNRETTG
jgi:ADP-ribose pyrophosphatase YjhB (NUDIX family)